MKKEVYWKVSILIVVLAALLLVTSLAAARPSAVVAAPSDAALIEQLTEASNGEVRISYHDLTGRVRFIGATAEKAISQPTTLEAGVSAEQAARSFLVVYGPLFGVKDQATELTVMTDRTLADGRSFVRFQQVYQGVPVVGGELIVQLNGAKDVVSANGELLPDLDLSLTPALSLEAARQTALEKIAKGYGVTADALTATDSGLWIYHPALLEANGRPVSSLVWRFEVTATDLSPIREFVLVDAQMGVVTLQFNQIATGKNRVVYDNANNPALGLPGNGPVRVEGGPATNNNDVDYAYDYAGHTYDFFLNEHGRDSLDGNGMALISTVRYCDPSASCPFANAFWNGQQMAYGDGFSAADDVVGHELTHGVTDFTSHLFYFNQSGAINESLSDVWGEFIDQTNGSGTDNDSVKWLMGEDVPGFGAIRDMADPPAFQNPDSMTSFWYYCGEEDNGGVHSNSGVNNKAVYLMTDGGSFNGYTVTGLGISKVADLYYEVQANMLTSGGNYLDLYDYLIQASINLGYSVSERQEIQDALHAVEMNTAPCFELPAELPLCPTAVQSASAPVLQPTGSFSIFLPVATKPIPVAFFDNLENPASGWWVSAATAGTNQWYYPQTANPYQFDPTYTTSGIYNFWGYDLGAIADYYIATAFGITIPANAYLNFRHDWAFEDDPGGDYDGGVVEYSANGAPWTDAGPLFTYNGYNGTINTCCGNPLGGRSAFVDNAHGYTTSRLDLGALAGQTVSFRFRIGTDESFDDYGWFIDDIMIYSCN